MPSIQINQNKKRCVRYLRFIFTNQDIHQSQNIPRFNQLAKNRRSLVEPEHFKRQPHKMVKHTQTIRGNS